MLLITSVPMISGNEITSMDYSTQSNPASYTEVTRDVEFALGKTFEVDNTVTPDDFTERSAATVAESVNDFLPEGLERVTDVDVYSTDLTFSITQIYVIEDREFLDGGSIFLTAELNRDQTSLFDNDGSYYYAHDGTLLDVDNIVWTTSLTSMDGWFAIEIHGWEADPIIEWPDDYMGGEVLWFNLNGYASRSVSGWVSLDDYAPDGGVSELQMQVYIEFEFTNIQVLSYPDNFMTSFDGSWLISYVYFPKVYYDTFDFGNTPLIESIYQQVYYGYDPSINANAYLIYYMFYWEYEAEIAGILMGHYYDYEPLLMYVEEIGQEPYRIVYRNVGDRILPPELVIQDNSVTPHSGSSDAEVSTPLMPLLGDQSSVDYRYTDIYFNTPAFHYETIHGLTPFMTVPYITITNTFHQMEVGVPLGSGMAGLPPLEVCMLPMTNDVIREGYGRLDEAFDSAINVYEGVNLFGGGDYRVPYNMSLTLDMLHNPFEFPYIVDCMEDIVHYTETAQDYRENGLYYDIDLGLSFSVPATVTFDIPTQVTVGETYDVGIDLALDAEDITISFAYDILLEYVLHWWFIGFEDSVSYSGQCDFNVNLEEVSDLISFLGLSSESVTGDYHGEWITVSDFSTSTDLLGTMLDCTVEIHLLTILSDLLGATGVGQLIDVLYIFFSDIDLIANPTLSGYVTADLLTENTAISLDTSELTFSEGTTQKTVQMTAVGGASQSGIRLSNMQYNVEFSTDWSVGFDFSDVMNYFVNDLDVPIGTFPTITISSEDHEISAETTTGYDQQVVLSVVEPPPPTSTTTTTSTTGTTSTSTGTTSNTGDTPPPDFGNLTLLVIVSTGMIVAVGVLVVFLKRKT